MKQNKTILVVDDEQGILDLYTEFLGGLSKRIKRSSARKKHINFNEEKDSKNYNLITATSGENAVEMVKEELAQGRRIATGFFDMKMPGGMDGLETIKKIRELDPNVLCLIVTAYEDRAIEEINKLFVPDHEDEWDYLNKPFTKKEIFQKANNLTSSWNRRKREEEYRKDLKFLISTITDIKKINPENICSLYRFFLKQICDLLNCEDAFFASIKEGGRLDLKIGVGRYSEGFEDKINNNNGLKSKILTSIYLDDLIIYEGKLILPLVVENWKNLTIVLDVFEISKNKKELLKIYLNNVAISLNNYKLYMDLEEINKKLEEKVFERTKSLEITNKKLTELTQKDYLTGVYNHRYFQEQIQTAFEFAKRNNQKLSLLFCDIDNFKVYNDSQGHVNGDNLLKKIANLLCNSLRGDLFRLSDTVIARYGGDEFVIILPQTDKAGAIVVAKRISEEMKNDLVDESENMPGKEITLSIGVAEYPSDVSTLKELVSLADKALYSAKAQGKNRVA